MNIVIAPDSFKGSMSSSEAAAVIQAGIISVFENSLITMVPIADGGEGTIEAIITPLSGEKIGVIVEDPLGHEINGYFGWVSETSTAIVETAVASGLTLLKNDELNPLLASTYGTGQLMKAALDQGAERIIIGIGGSATVDAGVGFLQALGARYYDENEKLIERIGGQLSNIHRIDITLLDKRLDDVEIIVACDVTNPLLGPNGAIYIFGPQKGVTNNQLEQLEIGMESFARLTEQEVGRNFEVAQGSGAAGGFGFSLMSYLDVTLQSGFNLVAELTSLQQLIDQADLVISGEGKLDNQTLFGKGPMGISEMAKKKQVPVLLFAGSVETPFLEAVRKENIVAIPILHQCIQVEEAMAKGPELLFQATQTTMKALKIGMLLGTSMSSS